MKEVTIFDEDIWPIILEENIALKDLAKSLGMEKDPIKARKMYDEYHGKITKMLELTKEEQAFVIELCSLVMVKQNLTSLLVMKGTFATQTGNSEDATGAFLMLLDDFEASFNSFLKEVQKRNIDFSNISFEKAYEIFLEVIVLKKNVIVPYTKLFIAKLLEFSMNKEEDEKEIREVIIRKYPDIYNEIYDSEKIEE